MTTAATNVPTSAGSGGWTVSASPLWAVAAVLSLVCLWFWAPTGLLLLAFIAVIVFVHELGHLLLARRAGMKPTEFFWGFGPEVVAIERNGCRYGVKALFLGGYVKIWGMTPTSALPDGIEEADTYRAASHAGRLATILAGPLVNIAMAIAAFAAAEILDGATVAAAIGTGFGMTWEVIAGTAQSLWLFATNVGGYVGATFNTDAEAPVRFMSPVSQAELTGHVVESGVAMSLRWFAILSCAIGAINLVPLPPLDGAHAIVAAGEKLGQIVRRDPSVRFDVRRLEPVAYLTIAVLVTLSVSALVMDIQDVRGL
ncbi:MAG: site-2 protease family protein [Acidimicrobiales bacterium]